MMPTIGTPAPIVIEKSSASEPAELEAVTCILKVPNTVGVPVSEPPLNRVKPVGTPVAVQVGVGDPVAAKE